LRQLQQHIEARGLGNRFVIHQPVDDIYSEYQRSQFLVLSSDFEGFGLVIIEAMACGLPVVATDCPYGPSDIIDDGKTGLLSQMNVKDLAEKIEWMITHEKERMEMGLRAHEASARYQLERVMPQWLAAYQSVI
jgi:glycosyltransferase involved in cell wall biosynthesis